MADLRWGAATHTGQVRSKNQDDLHAGDTLFVVADGMGGHQAGEVASRITVERLVERLTSRPDDSPPTVDDLVAAIAEANTEILETATANPEQAGMGTTVTALAILPDPDPSDDGDIGETLVLANVGDSRTYLLRNGRLRQLSVDHNYVSELVAEGYLTAAEARHHPRRNIVTRALGIESDVRVDSWRFPLVRGDRYVLCSDGLNDEVPDEEIEALVAEHEDPQTAAQVLVDRANQLGGRDNITVVVVDVLDGASPPDPTEEFDVLPAWAAPTGEVPTVADGSLGTSGPGQDGPGGQVTPAAAAAGLAAAAGAGSHEGALVDPAMATGPAAAGDGAPDGAAPDGPAAGDAVAGTTTTTGAGDGTGAESGTGIADGPATTDPTNPDALAHPTSGTGPATTTADTATGPGSTPLYDGGSDLDDGATGADTGSPAAVLPPPVPGAAGPGAATDGSTPPPARRPGRRRLGTFLALLGVAVVLTLGVTILSAWARSGYFVTFDGDDVVIYRGRPGGVLWFDPTFEARGPFTRDQLDERSIAEVEAERTFETRRRAQQFVTDDLTTTTTSTTPPPATTTTTVAPTTTAAPTTTVSPTTTSGDDAGG
jgi:protein phosphatase